ncbi:MAG TPA: SIS domain-containing protein [Acidimicrobiia bacterium]|nr:SIS domain-containing protein [Acidimicrobiia bacterium]
MCGIVGVVRRRSRRAQPDGRALVASLDAAVARAELDPPALVEVAALVEAADAALRGVPGVRALVADPGLAADVDRAAGELEQRLRALEADLDVGAAPIAPSGLEAINAALVRCKDAVWAVCADRLRTAREVAALAGAGASLAALEAFTSVQTALSALDRLEVRGRDSAGLHLLVRGHGLDLESRDVRAALAARGHDPLFGSGSVRAAGEHLAFVYKAAAEIGELGDNTAALRAAIAADELLHAAVVADTAEAVVLAHTRWASVGAISEANAHPLNHEEPGRPDGPYVAAALNGDVDNYVDLQALERLEVLPEVTTDAKVIPVLTSRRLARGADPAEAFRATVAGLEGSVAVAASSAAAPDKLFLALRGSGQALYVGLAEDAFVVASEPYGLVEETPRYVRMDGETPADPARPGATRGQVVVVDAAAAGELAGITRLAYDGTPLPVTVDDVHHAQITTRDVDRGEAQHYLLKEITESPASFRTTLRGKIVDGGGGPTVELPPEALPGPLRARLRAGEVRRVFVVGQGTAAVAGRSFAAALERAAGTAFLVEALPATELSGFGLRADMSDTLVVAISQSGTTTDTNRTVDLVRAHGAAVVSIVNRRNSDLVDKSDGVLYTSDGRDVEMSVASTKAFYAQIAAGFLLAIGIAREAGVLDEAWASGVLAGLRELPDVMQEVIGGRAEVAQIAQRQALTRRYWAVVGNGANSIAANEVRIKLSELCYKAIACDVTEDKKHIDLSSEPLIVVCAPGLSGGTADDVGKEIAIYRAHRAAPVVIASESAADRYPAALETVVVPDVHPDLAFVLAAVVGHLFGYEAALAIDSSARPLREARAAIAARAPVADTSLDWLARAVQGPARAFSDELRQGHYDGTLEASTAVGLASLFRYATGAVPLDFYELEHGAVGTPGAVAEDLVSALTKAIDELTRPVDAIKHQAKTVTVGISRSDETLLHVPLVRAVLDGGVPRDSLTYRALRTLVDLDPAVEEVTGYTRYRVEGDPGAEGATVHIVDRGGVAVELPSRTDTDPRLRGTKHRVATTREVTAVRGYDGRTVVIVPEVKHNQVVGLALLHARFAEHLPPDVMRAVLQGYQGRYAALKDAVTETEPLFDDAVLGTVGVIELLTEPVYVLARLWRGR